MFCVNIITNSEDHLKEEMQNMITWLDHKRFEPIAFWQSKTKSGMLFNLYFEDERKAVAFAAAFGGCVQSASGSVVA